MSDQLCKQCGTIKPRSAFWRSGGDRGMKVHFCLDCAGANMALYWTKQSHSRPETLREKGKLA